MSTDEMDESPLAGRAAESGQLRGSTVAAAEGGGQPAGEDDDGEAEEVPDWLSFAKFAKTLGGKGSGSTTGDPIIPKRGEKDFEPASEDRYVNLQTSLLDASRAALFTAISSGSRHHSSRAHNRAVWNAGLSKAYMVHVEDPALPCRAPVVADQASGKPVPQATTHGVHFLTMGRHEPARKRLELLPEEALYLLERGTIECWTGEDETAVPMSLQHAWSQMIHAGELNAERYQVYAWLKRLGYTVVRADYPRPRSEDTTGSLVRHSAVARAMRRISQHLRQLLASLTHLAATPLRAMIGPGLTALQRLDLVGKGKQRSLLDGQRWFSYDQIFTALQLIQSGPRKSVSKAQEPAEKQPADPYQVFFHVYKPVTKFRKSDPPEPDFLIAVINAETTPIPNLPFFESIFDELPEQPIAPAPAPRTRPPRPGAPAQIQAAPPNSLLFMLRDRVLCLLGLRQSGRPARAPTLTRPAPFARLKAGSKSAIIAVVDNGTVSYQRFGDTDFGVLPWVGDGFAA